MGKQIENDTRPLYNSRIIDNYIKLIKKKYLYIDVENLLNYAGMTEYEISDEGQWFTQSQVNRFHEKLSELTNDSLISREAGRYAASPDAFGAMKLFFLSLVGPDKAYELIGRGARNLTRSSVFKTKRLDSNKVEILVEFESGVSERPFQCENRKGFFEAISLTFGHPMPKIDHPECVFQGGKRCRYVISWSESKVQTLKQVRNYATIILFALCLVVTVNASSVGLSTILPVAIVVVSILSLVGLALEKRDIAMSLNKVIDSVDKLVKQIELNHNNAVLTGEIGQSISSQADSVDILSNIVNSLKKWLDYDRCMILLTDVDKKHLYFSAGYGYTDQQLNLLRQTSFHLDKPESRGVFVTSFRGKKPFLINKLEEIDKNLSEKSRSYARELSAESFICCPIVINEESIGILAVDNIKSKRSLVKTDLSLMVGIASVVGISLKNDELLTTKNRQFHSIIAALAASIDARDPLTKGHSEKVTEYAVGICEELGMPKDYREVISVAALLHDYGKIGVPDAILKKPDPLESGEYEIIKTHAQRTHRILSQINFEGIYKDVPAIASGHHERMDGTGYPKGLVGDEIPLGARIIAVSDFFEAITAERHYRKPMPIADAIDMLKKQSDINLDPMIVRAFLRYYQKAQEREEWSEQPKPR